MIDLFSFDKSLKSTWIKKDVLKNCGSENILTSNLNTKDTLEISKVSNAFFRETLEIWGEINFQNQVMSEEHFLDQPLWYDSLIKIGNKPVFSKDWLGKGVTKVRHLLGNDNNIFLSLNDFCLKYNLNVRPLSFYGIVTAVKSLRNSTWQISKDIISKSTAVFALGW